MSDDERMRAAWEAGANSKNKQIAELVAEVERLKAQIVEARKACQAGIRYDALLQKAGEHPELISTYGMVESDSLDEAFDDWISKVRAFLAANPEPGTDGEVKA